MGAGGALPYQNQLARRQSPESVLDRQPRRLSFLNACLAGSLDVKTIDKKQLKCGMFIEDLEGSWQDNPFASRRFKLETLEQVRLLQASSVTAIVINTHLGADVQHDERGAYRTSDAKLERAPSKQNSLSARKAALSSFLLKSEESLHAAFNDILHRAGSAIDLVDPIVDEISLVLEKDPALLLSVSRLKTKDDTTYLHSIAVSALMMQLASHLGVEPSIVKQLGIAGLLHDIGKLKIPTEILTNPEKLTPEEFGIMRTHSRLGWEMLVPQKGMTDIVLDVCLHHHERIDGSGYPVGLDASELSLHAKLAGVCDVFEATTSARPYKKAWNSGEAISWMLDQGTQFERTLVRKLSASLGSGLRRS